MNPRKAGFRGIVPWKCLMMKMNFSKNSIDILDDLLNCFRFLTLDY